MTREPLKHEELDRLIGDRPHEAFLNTRNVLYRDRGYKTNPPTRGAALQAMAEESNLVRRPLLIHGERMHWGSDETAIRLWLTGG